MTAAEKATKLFASLIAMLGSDQPGERMAALEKLHALRAQMGWPSFADLLRMLENIITPEQLEAAEKDRDQWKRAHEHG